MFDVVPFTMEFNNYSKERNEVVREDIYEFYTPPAQNKMRNGDSGEEGDDYWIVKPGENSNRGRGIVVCVSMDEAIN